MTDEWVLPWTAEETPAEAGNRAGTWWVRNARGKVVAENLFEASAQLIVDHPGLWEVLSRTVLDDFAEEA